MKGEVEYWECRPWPSECYDQIDCSVEGTFCVIPFISLRLFFEQNTTLKNHKHQLKVRILSLFVQVHRLVKYPHNLENTRKWYFWF